MYFDRHGEPMELSEWVAALGPDNRVALTKVGGHEVSTIWMGLDPTLDVGTPLIFETIIYFNDRVLTQERYATEEEAKEGHARHVAKLERELEL